MMIRFRRLTGWIALFSLLLIPGSAEAPRSWTVEVDLDGTLLNGPDHISVGYGEQFEADLWFHGPDPLFSYGVAVDNLDGSIEYLDFDSNHPDGWTLSVTYDSTFNRIEVIATDFSFTDPLVLPYRMGTLTCFAAVDESWDDLTIPFAGYFATWFSDGVPDELIGASVLIGGTTGTAPSSWGAVKGMFR